MLERQVLKLLYDNYPFAIFMTLLLSAMEAIVVLNENNSHTILYWYAVLLLLQCLRFGDFYYYKWIQKGKIFSVYDMFRNFRIGIILTGITLGAFPVLLAGKVMIIDMVFIAFVLGGISAAAMTSLGVDKVSYVSFLWACLLPLMVSFFSLGGLMQNIMGTMILFYVIYLMFSASRFRRQIVSNVVLTDEALQDKKAISKRQKVSEMIVKIQAAYLEKKITGELYKSVLKEIIKLSDCQFGFICLVSPINKQEFSSKVVMNFDQIDLSRLSGEKLQLDELNKRPLTLEAYFSQVVLSGKSVEVDYIEFFQGVPSSRTLGNFYGMPLYFEDELIAVIGLINIYHSVNEESLEFLQPLFLTIERFLVGLNHKSFKSLGNLV
tara:strand:- start:509 stop:1645 length:1137 start_codon:yes stop_codon:yes gene_type:complete